MKLKQWSETGVKTLLSYKKVSLSLVFQKREHYNEVTNEGRRGFGREFYRDKFEAESGSQDDKRILSHKKESCFLEENKYFVFL
jgi:hypothetical protein